ncbi:hypothetical protein M0R45_019638 [Rubus argutus]|uniref:Uncharacterized protein n=1 Tax=Rubus argutus TaxID=59490 RepID=A0AAW1X8E2_RUBAR
MGSWLVLAAVLGRSVRCRGHGGYSGGRSMGDASLEAVIWGGDVVLPAAQRIAGWVQRRLENTGGAAGGWGSEAGVARELAVEQNRARAWFLGSRWQRGRPARLGSREKRRSCESRQQHG